MVSVCYSVHSNSSIWLFSYSTRRYLMKVLIKDESGRQTEVDAQSILIKGKPLVDYLSELEQLKRSFQMFVDQSHVREKNLLELWRSIK